MALTGGKLPGEQRKRVPEQLVPRMAAISTVLSLHSYHLYNVESTWHNISMLYLHLHLHLHLGQHSSWWLPWMATISTTVLYMAGG